MRMAAASGVQGESPRAPPATPPGHAPTDPTPQDRCGNKTSPPETARQRSPPQQPTQSRPLHLTLAPHGPCRVRWQCLLRHGALCEEGSLGRKCRRCRHCLLSRLCHLSLSCGAISTGPTRIQAEVVVIAAESRVTLLALDRLLTVAAVVAVLAALVVGLVGCGDLGWGVCRGDRGASDACIGWCGCGRILFRDGQSVWTQGILQLPLIWVTMKKIVQHMFAGRMSECRLPTVASLSLWYHGHHGKILYYEEIFGLLVEIQLTLLDLYDTHAWCDRFMYPYMMVLCLQD